MINLLEELQLVIFNLSGESSRLSLRQTCKHFHLICPKVDVKGYINDCIDNKYQNLIEFSLGQGALLPRDGFIRAVLTDNREFIQYMENFNLRHNLVLNDLESVGVDTLKWLKDRGYPLTHQNWNINKRSFERSSNLLCKGLISLKDNFLDILLCGTEEQINNLVPSIYFGDNSLNIFMFASINTLKTLYKYYPDSFNDINCNVIFFSEIDALDKLKFCFDKCPRLLDEHERIKRTRNIDICEWLLSNNVDCSLVGIHSANLEVLKWRKRNGLPLTNGKFSTMEKLVFSLENINVFEDKDCLKHAVYSHNIEIVKALCDYLTPYGLEKYIDDIFIPDEEIIRYIYDMGFKLYNKKNLANIRTIDFLEIISDNKILNDNDFSDVISLAVQNDNMICVKFILNKQKGFFNDKAVGTIRNFHDISYLRLFLDNSLFEQSNIKCKKCREILQL